MDDNALIMHREKLYNQIKEAYSKVTYSYMVHVVEASKIYKKNKRIKAIQLILSGINMGGVLSTIITNKIALAWVGAICSTILVIITSYFKDVETIQIQKSHRDTANKLWSIREDYFSLLIDFNIIEEDEIISRRDQLKDRVQAVYDLAPITDSNSYTIAQKFLNEIESDFLSEEELNKILPKSLRNVK